MTRPWILERRAIANGRNVIGTPWLSTSTYSTVERGKTGAAEWGKVYSMYLSRHKFEFRLRHRETGQIVKVER